MKLERKQVKRLNRSWSPTLRRIARRSIQITPEQVRGYTPREIDLKIAEAMLSGALSQDEIAESAEVSKYAISKALRNLTACAWISQQVRQHIAYRLGNIDTALYAKAMGGDVRAMDLFYKQFGKIQERSLHVHAHVGGFDPSKLSSGDLDKIIQSKLRSHGKEAAYETIDAGNSGSTNRRAVESTSASDAGE